MDDREPTLPAGSFPKHVGNFSDSSERGEKNIPMIYWAKVT